MRPKLIRGIPYADWTITTPLLLLELLLATGLPLSEVFTCIFFDEVSCFCHRVQNFPPGKLLISHL